jgi:DNA polymerase elongation subunit (family B)
MIRVLASANNSHEFVAKVPEALKVIKEYRRRLLAGEISIWDLIVTKHLSKHPKDYKQKVSQVIAAEQLIKEGADISAGKNVRFLFTSAENKRYERRVKAEELIEKNTNSDMKKYLLLLYASAANLLSPAGYSINEVYEFARGYQRTKIAPQ